MLFRHDLVWIANKATPFVVTLQTVQDLARLNVAECLSPDKSILSRVATVIEKSSIIKHEKPLLLSKLLEFESNTEHANNIEKLTIKCSPNDLEKISHILTKIKSLGLELRIFGSASWQYFTHTAFINSNSDLDIIIYLNNIKKIPIIGNYLQELERLIHRKIDGEFVYKNKYFIAINEWLNSTSEVLVKTNSEILLMKKSDQIFF